MAKIPIFAHFFHCFRVLFERPSPFRALDTIDTDRKIAEKSINCPQYFISRFPQTLKLTKYKIWKRTMGLQTGYFKNAAEVDTYSTSNLNFDNSILFYLANFLFYSILVCIFYSVFYSILLHNSLLCSILYSILLCILFYFILSCSLFYSILFVFYSVNYFMQTPKFCKYFFYIVNFNLLLTYMYIIK